MSDNPEINQKYDDAYWKAVASGSAIPDEKAWQALGFSGEPSSETAADKHESQQK